MQGELYPGEFEAMEYNGRMDAIVGYPKNDCDTCKHNDKEWDELPCDGCTNGHSWYDEKQCERMTRGQAIHQLKTIISVSENNERNEKEIDACDLQALKMAIAALEAQIESETRKPTDYHIRLDDGIWGCD